VQLEGREVWLLDHGEIGGGGQRFGLRLALELRARGANVRVGCEGDTGLAGWCHAEGIEVAHLRFPRLAAWRLPSVAAAVARTRRFLGELDADALVIANHPRAQGYVYAATRGRRPHPAIVNLAHEQDSARRLSARFAYRRFGALMVIGDNSARIYRQRLPSVPLAKANNFLPPEYFRRAAARRPGSPPDRPAVLGVLARLTPEKGLVELIDEVSAEEVRSDWRQLLVGAPFQDPSYTKAVRRRIEEVGLGERVRLLGEVEDVPGFLGQIDALVVPSTGNEAQPTVILEALAHGVPVIVRQPLWSSDYEALPVAAYQAPVELGSALRGHSLRVIPPDELIRRFGPDQAIAALEASAQAASARS
jgi:glycosyltransferase involved in cell wall biosynthesis